jgi:hypothetical protein
MLFGSKFIQYEQVCAFLGYISGIIEQYPSTKLKDIS